MTRQGGFTLVEALVAGFISVIIPGVVIALLGVNNSELAVNSNLSRLNQIANAVSDDIKTTALKSYTVFPGPGAPPTCPGPPATDPTGDAFNSYTSVVFCDANSIVIKSYRVVDIGAGLGRLEERIGAGPWKHFAVGSDTIKVDYDMGAYQQKPGGFFGIGDEAQFVYFNFHYRMKMGGSVTTLAMQTESVVCRNSVSRLW